MPPARRTASCRRRRRRAWPASRGRWRSDFPGFAWRGSRTAPPPRVPWRCPGASASRPSAPSGRKIGRGRRRRPRRRRTGRGRMGASAPPGMRRRGRGRRREVSAAAGPVDGAAPDEEPDRPPASRRGRPEGAGGNSRAPREARPVEDRRSRRAAGTDPQPGGGAIRARAPTGRGEATSHRAPGGGARVEDGEDAARVEARLEEAEGRPGEGQGRRDPRVRGQVKAARLDLI